MHQKSRSDGRLFLLHMSPIPIRAVLFDLDGTLADTSAEISSALASAFHELGVAPLAHRKAEALIGRGVHSLVERALFESGARGVDLEDAVRRFEAHYVRTVATQAELFPGVMPGLERLRAARFPMSVVTNKPRYFTEKLLARMNVDSVFAAIVTGDDGLPRKPQGDMLVAACRAMGSRPEETLMLGDSDNDVLAARAAGCPVWCVPYGYNEGRAPQTLACDRMVATVEEAAELLIGPRPSPG
jgi:phosphoglycolate phosphatase